MRIIKKTSSNMALNCVSAALYSIMRGYQKILDILFLSFIILLDPALWSLKLWAISLRLSQHLDLQIQDS